MPPAGGWADPEVVAARRADRESFAAQCTGTGPLGPSAEGDAAGVLQHNLFFTFGWALALASRETAGVSVLDWGSGPGRYAALARALLPGVRVDYHCVDVAAAVEGGRSLDPTVTWHAGDSWRGRTYDLVVANASLQYVEAWPALFAELAAVTGRYFLVTRVPVAGDGIARVAVQREGGTRMLHGLFAAEDVLSAGRNCGLVLVRELFVGDRPYVHGLPSGCEMKGWLFRR